MTNSYTLLWKTPQPEIHRMGCEDIEKKRAGAMVKNFVNWPSLEKAIERMTENFGDAYGFKILPCTKKN